MKNRIKRIIFSVLLIGIITMPCIPVSAVDSYGYYLEFTVTDTGGVARTNVPVLLSSLIGSNLVSAGYIDSDGLDTRLKEITTAMEYMLATTQGAMIIPTLAAYQTKTYRLYMNYSPDNTGFPIIVGDAGYVTVIDAAALELGNNFEIEVSGYFDTLYSSDSNIILKTAAINLYLSAADTITCDIYDSESSFSSTSMAFGLEVYGSNWGAQTFTTTGDCVIPRVIVGGTRNGTPAGDLYVSIYATSAGKPTGSPLYTEIVDATGWSTSNAFNTIVFGTPFYAASSTMYALVLSSPDSANSSNCFYWKDNNRGSISNGTKCSSSDSGASWSISDTYDFATYIYYSTVALSQSATVTSGEHILKISADGTTFYIYLDDVLQTSTAVSSVPNNTNNWLLFKDSSMPYVDYYKQTVGGTLIVKYQPASMLTSTAVPDLEGTAQNGTITWGSNVDLTVTMLGITPFTSYVSTAGENTIADTVNPAEMPASWYSDITDISTMPFYETFNAKATEMGMPTQTLYVMMMLGTAVAVGLGVLVFTGSAMAAVLSCGVAIAAGVNTGMLSGWMLLIFFIFGVGILYLARQN